MGCFGTSKVPEQHYKFRPLAPISPPALYNQAKSEVNELANALCVALTSDGWTFSATESYLVIAHHITPEWDMRSTMLLMAPFMKVTRAIFFLCKKL